MIIIYEILEIAETLAPPNFSTLALCTIEKIIFGTSVSLFRETKFLNSYYVMGNNMHEIIN